MGGAVSSGRDNNELIDNLMGGNYIRTRTVERVFRALDRADYMTPEARDQAYKDLAWRNGPLHMSAPCIYSEVLEGLELKPGLSFLNIGSGTGYFSTLVGLIIGSGGINHGVEVHPYVVEYAIKKLGQFIENSPTLDEFDYCEPRFYCGNGLCLAPLQAPYDRVYCGAGCPEEYENYFKQLIKVGGILVMPLNDNLVQVRRTAVDSWTSKNLLNVSFATLRVPTKEEAADLIRLEEQCPTRLQVLARAVVRSGMRASLLCRHPHLREPPPRRPQPANSCPRRICIPIEDDSDVEGLNALHDLDHVNGANEMNALLSLVLSMGQNRVAGALRFDSLHSPSDSSDEPDDDRDDHDDGHDRPPRPDSPRPDRSPLPDRSSPSERSPRPDRSSPSERSPRPDRSSPSERSPRPDRSSPSERSPRPDRSSPSERSPHPDRSSPSERSPRPDRSSPSKRSPRLDQPSLSERSSRSDRSPSDRSPRSDRSQKSDRSPHSDRPPPRPERVSRPAPPDVPESCEHCPKSARSCRGLLTFEFQDEHRNSAGSVRHDEPSTSDGSTKSDTEKNTNPIKVPAEVEIYLGKETASTSRDMEWEETVTEEKQESSSEEEEVIETCKEHKRKKLDSGIGEGTTTSSGSSPVKSESNCDESDDVVRSDNLSDDIDDQNIGGPRRRQKRGRCAMERSASSSSGSEGAAGAAGAESTEGAEGGARRTRKRRAQSAARRRPGADARRVRLSIMMKRGVKELPLPYALKKYVNLGRCFEF